MAEFEIEVADLSSHVTLNIAAGGNESEAATSDLVGMTTTDVNMKQAKWLSALGLFQIAAAGKISYSFLSSSSVPLPFSAAYYAVLSALAAVDVAVMMIVSKAKFAKWAALAVAVLVPVLAFATKVYAAS